MARLTDNDSSLNDKVFNRIFEDVMSLHLEPGMVVSVQKLADMYGCSRTPAREAVIRLHQKKLVRVYPQSHTVIAPISNSRLEEETFISRSLETAAVDKFLHNCSVFVLDTMDYMVGILERAAQSDNRRQFFQTVGRFHNHFFSIAGEMLSAETIGATATDFNRLAYLCMARPSAMARLVIPHQQFMDAARQMDAPRLEAAIEAYPHLVMDMKPAIQQEYATYFSE